MSENRLTRRSLLASSAVIAAGGVLAACAQPTPTAAPQAPSPAPQVEAPTAESPTGAPQPAGPSGALIRHWTAWSSVTFSDAWNEIQKSDDFKQALGDNVYEMKTGVGDEALLTAVASGDPPEGASNVESLDFMARDVLFAIDELVAASQIIKKDNFLPGIWDLCMYKGKTLSMPFMEGFVPYGLVYNSKLAQEAGLDPTKPPVTWDQVYDWQVKLTQKDAAGNVTRMGLDPFAAMGQGIWFAGGFMAATSWGWKWFDESTRTFNFDNEKMVDAFATFKKLVDVVGIDNLMAVYATEGQDEWGGAYYAEIQSMLINGYWFPGEAMNNNPEVAKGTMATWLPVPESRRGTKVQSVYTSMLILFRQSKNPEVMYRIGEIMTLKPACDAVFNKTGWLPPIKTYLDTVDPSVYPGLDFYFDCVKEATEWHRPAVCEITRYASNKYAALREQVCRGELTPEEAAKLFQSDCTQEYINQGFAS